MNTYSYKLFSITLHKISLITFQIYTHKKKTYRISPTGLCLVRL